MAHGKERVRFFSVYDSDILNWKLKSRVAIEKF